MIKLNKKISIHNKLRYGVMVVLLVCMTGGLGYLSSQYRLQWDVSQNGRNSLSETSIEIVQKMQGPIQVTVYASEQQAQLGDVRKIIADFVLLYQRIKPDLALTFVDPIAQPQLAQAANIQVNGEIVIGFNQKIEHLTTINEQAFSNALMRLARTEKKLILELSGHGERRLDGHANYDLGDFGQQLRVNGFVHQPLNFAIAREIAPNADVLLIASPQTELLPGEVDKLLDYIDNGGNLLWLVDQEPLRGLLPLAEKLHLTLTPGVIVDPQAKGLKAPETFALGAIYGQHPIVGVFNYITVFPFARQIMINENEEWHSVGLVEVAPKGWIEAGDLNAAASFDLAVDVPGPIGVAAALTRMVQDREQRIVVVGSGHFLANTYLGNGSNLDFGINLINWLVGDEELIVIQPRPTLDHNLVFSETQLTMLAVISFVILPALLLIGGVAIWWCRRRN